MKWLLRVLMLIVLVLAIIVPIALAETIQSDMPVAPSWPEFVAAAVATGAWVLFVLNLLIKYLPAGWGDVVKRMAVYLVPLLTFFSPQIADAILLRIPYIHNELWSALYFFAAWIAHEVLYNVGQKRVWARLNGK